MITILRPRFAKTESENPWSDENEILSWDAQTAKQLPAFTSHIKSYGLGYTDRIPAMAEVVGIEAYLDLCAPSLGDKIVVATTTVTVNLNNDGWIHAIDFEEGEYLEITASGGGTWDGTNFAYPEGSYWNGGSGFPHADEPASINNTRPSNTGDLVKDPTSVSQSGSDWNNLTNALTIDSSYAELNADTGASGWIKLATMSGIDIPSGATIAGITLTGRIGCSSGSPSADTDYTVEFGISFDGGSTVSGVTKKVNTSPGATTDFTIGSAADLWSNGSISPSQVNPDTFCIMARRPSIGATLGFTEDTSKNRRLHGVQVNVRCVGGDWYADNTAPFCLLGCIRALGTVANSIGTDLHDAYRVGRFTYLDPARLGYSVTDVSHPGQSGWFGDSWYPSFYSERFVPLTTGSLFLCFNDMQYLFGANTGSFEVTIRRIKPVYPEQNSVINHAGIDKPHYPPFNTPNGTETRQDIVVPTNGDSWIDTGIDVNPGENLSFIVTWSSQPYRGASQPVFPEGHYTDVPSEVNHTYDPDEAAVTASGFPTSFAASNCRPFSVLAYLLREDDSLFADLTGASFTTTLSDAVQLNRACSFDSSRLPNSGGGRLLLIFNDKLSDFSDNTGSFTVTVVKGSGNNHAIDFGIGLRDGYDVSSHWKQATGFDSLRTIVLGHPSDLWGRVSWSPTELNDLASLIQRRCIMTGECTVDSREIDSTWLVVYWSEPGGLFNDMAEREAVKQKIHFGKESSGSKGTAVTCTRRAMGFKINPTMNGDFKSWRAQGNKSETLHMLMREWCSSSLSGVPNYTELGYLLASVIGLPVSTGGVVDTLNVHTFRFDDRFEQDLQTYTFEYGTPDTRAHRCTYGFFHELAMNFTRQEAELSGNFMARAITDGITMSGGANEVQTITISGTPTGGTFKLRFKGAETSALAYNISAANLTTALEALSTIGSGGVVATGSAGGPYTVTFSGSALSAMQQPLIERSNNSLTGGTSPDVAITQATQGGFGEDVIVPILPGNVSIYMADTYATLSSGRLTRARMANFAIAGRSDVFWTLNDQESSFAKHHEAPITIKTNLELQADSNGMALLANARANAAGKFVRIQAIGPIIGATADYHKLTIDMYCKVSAFGNLQDQDGIYQTNFELSALEEPNWGNTFVITLENGKTGY